MDYKVEFSGAYANKNFLPYYMVSNRYGVVAPEGSAAYVRGAVDYRFASCSFSFKAGMDCIGSSSSSTAYYKHNYYLQQLYAEVAWNKFAVFIGAREDKPFLVNGELSSGNMLWSGNVRPVPQIRVGTADFVGLPGTNGWVNFYVDISYGRQRDGDYNQDVCSLMDSEKEEKRSFHIVDNAMMHRKNLFIRTKLGAPVVFTAGLEHIAQFGGTVDGVKCGAAAKDYLKVLLAKTNNEGNEYSHLASIDLRADVNLTKGTLSVYTQLFMDEISKSGSFRQNGTDGLWGLEWNRNDKTFLKNVVLEYLKTTNQGGPVYANEESRYDGKTYHYYACTYYNDQHYGAWSNYGMACGNPLLKSPIYNEDHFPGFTNTLVKAVHLGMKGDISDRLEYRMLFSYRKSWGEPLYLLPLPVEDTSGLLECKYKIKGWSFLSSIAFDSGSMYGDNWGIYLSVRKIGSLFKNK